MKERIIYGIVLASTVVSPVKAPPGLPGASGNNNTNSSEIKVIISFADAVIGALSVLVITISGLRYTTSDGDPQKLAQARSGIIYALVGIAVALTAQAIVTFVVGNI